MNNPASLESFTTDMLRTEYDNVVDIAKRHLNTLDPTPVSPHIHTISSLAFVAERARYIVSAQVVLVLKYCILSRLGPWVPFRVVAESQNVIKAHSILSLLFCFGVSVSFFRLVNLRLGLDPLE